MTDLPIRHVVHPSGYGLGWRKDPLDARDNYFSASYEDIKKLPRKVWLSDMWEKVPVYDQSSLGSCTSQSIAGALEYAQIQQGYKRFTPSRLFVYFFERFIEGTTDCDCGAVIRDGFKVINKMGAPPETSWGYDISRFSERPPDAAIREALDYQSIRYSRVMQTPTQIRSAIAKRLPVVFGFQVYSNFFDIGSDGIMSMPGGSLEGGHAVVICGYDDDTGYFLVKNSWGQWGWDGFFLMPYAFATDPNLASDFWLVSKTEGIAA